VVPSSWRPGKPLLIGLPLVLSVGGMVGLFLAQGPGGGHTAANRPQLKGACGGLLPYEELRSLVPDEVDGDEPGETVSSSELAYERAVLRAFAGRSAEAHGCSAPVRS
jgi:hypothetical protein